ncbi:MAG: SDR family NAD(P)-dependent oxidoreductase [Gemmatimonadales bacterium]|nr:MAG: SDR family NAD(P)-dependent oxidoreductase [Gemmatimonadales bacterium]
MLITGSTGGLGREVARSLAADGVHVIIHGRNEERARELLEEIRATHAGSGRYYLADFASLEQVRVLGEAVLRDYDRLDGLVNNAGIARLGTQDRVLSENGHELHFQVNYLAGYLLTDLLLPLLREGAPSRIVNVASRTQAPIDLDDLMLEAAYSVRQAYGGSKLAQIMHAFELAEVLRGTGVTANALHPSGVMDTDMILEAGLQPQSSVLTGRNAVLRLLDDPDIGSGGYFHVFEPARAHEQAYDPEVRSRLMAVSATLTGAAPVPSPASPSRTRPTPSR